MVTDLGIDLKSVSRFFVVQADGPETEKETISDEKELANLSDAINLVRDSEAPIKYLHFNHSGLTYKLYPIEDSEEFQVIRTPILN
jgi:hypothetical protein